MEDVRHFVQDACEIYAVAELQRLAEEGGLAVTKDAGEKLEAFRAYAAERLLTRADFDKWPNYIENLKHHLPEFFGDLVRTLGSGPMDFIDVERDSRNLNLKGDFMITRPGHEGVSVSLKNYDKSAQRPQCSSGTFNSFPLNFIFETDGVGMFLDSRGLRFKGSSRTNRDAALNAAGLAGVVPLMGRLDGLNDEIKQRFVYGPDFEFLDESKFDKARKQVGSQGQAIILEFLELMGAGKIKDRLLKMTGLDGREEILLIDPKRRSDTITNEAFRNLRFGVSDPRSVVTFESRGQSIRFEFKIDGRLLLVVDVPFTINKNGAWISETYGGTRMHSKEGLMLATGQRRPKKSKELATSTNTYVDFGAAGIF